MLTYVEVKAQLNCVRNLTGVSEVVFEQLVPHFSSFYRIWRKMWTVTGQRRTGKRSSETSDADAAVIPEDLLLFILVYLRKLPTQENHGRQFGVPQPVTSAWIRSALPVLRDTLLHLQSSPMHDHNVLCARLLQNPVISALVWCGNEINVDVQSHASSLFSITSSRGLAPYIYINRKLSQSLLHSRGEGNDRLNLIIGELFSGAGGFGLGFILADHPFIRYHPLFAVDNDKVSLATYRENTAWLSEQAPEILDHKPNTFVRDVRKLSIPAVRRWAKSKHQKDDLDLLIGGPPCQGFSTSNKTNKVANKLKNNALVSVFLDAVESLRPKMFLMENVQGVRWTAPSDDMTLPASESSSPKTQQFKTVREFLRAKARALGYSIWDDILDAADYGVPQQRLRYFLFGIRTDLLSEPNPQQQISLEPYLLQCRAKQQVSVAEAIGDLPVLANGQTWIGKHYEPCHNTYITAMRRILQNGVLFDHRTTMHQEYVIERFEKIPPGGNWESIREQMDTYNPETINNTHRNIYRRLRPDAPANTISHYRKSMVIHPWQHRGLSFREACRLQSFPDWFRFSGGSGAQQQQLANAVPPLMAASVAYAIAEFFLDETYRKRLAER